jgi:hypothetical protein
MLAAMTSLASLAHAAQAPPLFNHDFYVAAATIIPVLFIALIVQGGGYENLLKAVRAVDRRTARDRPWYEQLAATAAWLVLMPIAYAIVAFGATSEAAAVYALYQKQASTATATFVLAGTIFMVIATAAGPALALMRILAANYLRENLDNLREYLNLLRLAGIIRGKPHARPARRSSATPARMIPARRNPRIPAAPPVPGRELNRVKRAQRAGNARNVRGR